MMRYKNIVKIMENLKMVIKFHLTIFKNILIKIILMKELIFIKILHHK